MVNNNSSNTDPESPVTTIQSMGGKARSEALTPERRKEIARMGGLARNLEQAEHSGKLTIGDMTFPCSVLSDGTRILTQSDFMAGMGMYYRRRVTKTKPAAPRRDHQPHQASAT